MFTIHALNSGYVTSTVLDSVDDHEEALSIGLNGAIDIVADELKRGQESSSVVVSVDNEDGVEQSKLVVSASISTLFVETVRDR